MDEHGGGFAFPSANAFFQFPMDAVSKPVTITCTRVRHKESPLELQKGEVFCSSMVKIESPETSFNKPVQVLLSHSAADEDAYADYYDITIKQLNQEWEDLATQRIARFEDLPGEIRSNFTIIRKYLPVAVATVKEVCTLVAVTRIRSEGILVRPGERCVFSKSYGNQSKLKISFPAGAVEEECNLSVQFFPADDIIDPSTKVSEDLVYFPVIKVSGQKETFRKLVDVELVYRHNDVAMLDNDFLPVGKKIPFKSEYGVLFRSHNLAKGDQTWRSVADDVEAMIERLGSDRVRVTFSVSHFSSVAGGCKKRKGADDPSLYFLEPQPTNFKVILLAVHEKSKSTNSLTAIMAPMLKKVELKRKWGYDGKISQRLIKSEQDIFFCVTLSRQEQKHVSLEDCSVRFMTDEITYTENDIVDESVTMALREKYMRFLLKPCVNWEHSGDLLLDKVRIKSKTSEKTETSTPAMTTGYQERRLPNRFFFDTAAEFSHNGIGNGNPPDIKPLDFKDLKLNLVDWSDVNQNSVDVVLLTGTNEEFLAAYKILVSPATADTGQRLGPVHFAKIGKNQVALVNSVTPGAVGVAGATNTCLDAIQELKPKAVIALGVCFGMDTEKLKLGDVLVSTQLALYGSCHATQNGEIRQLAPNPESHPRLMRIFDSGKVGWKYLGSEDLQPKVHLGQVLSGPEVIYYSKRREELRKLYPLALGGEIEMEGIHLICENHKIPWISCKSIGNWADGNTTKEWSPGAAKVSASFVKHVLDKFYIPKQTHAEASQKSKRVRDLDKDVLEMVCMKLNVRSPLRNDFRKLAELMQYGENDKERIEECDNPAGALLQHWGHRNQSTVDKLIKFLRTMGRDDVADIVIGHAI